MGKFFFFIGLFSLILLSCGEKIQSESYDPEGSTDTRTKPISYQVKRTWRIDNGDLSFTNEFTGARLNDISQINDSLYSVAILPENGPINKSPWFAFGVWSEVPRRITLELTYPEGYTHRYYPDMSRDLNNWSPVDSSWFDQDTVLNVTRLTLPVSPDTLYIAAQEVMTSEYVYDYTAELADMSYVTSDVIGYSRLGKPLPVLHAGNEESKEAIVIIGRQHPPEATGFLALQSFVNRLMAEDSLSNAFRSRYQIIVIPMINPDGVDLGHWRHSSAGIDLNRDWYSFNQPETSAVRDYLIPWSRENDADILFAIDFHSTQEDLFYVFDKDRPTLLTGFTHQWLDEIESRLGDYTADRIPTSGDSPVSTRWFAETFSSEAVTYEVGDNSPRTRIDQIGETAAESLMYLLLERQD